MDDLRIIVFQHHPTSFFTLATAFLASFTLTPSPPFTPLIVLVALTQVYARMFQKRRPVRRATLLWLALSFGSSLAALIPSLRALSSPGVSVLVLFLMSATSSFLALSIIQLDIILCKQFDIPWTQIALFPTLWASIWCGVAYASPIGRLALWSPAEGLDRYHWMVQWFGPAVNDWLVGAWAVVLSQAVGAWFIGPGPLEEAQQLIQVPEDNDSPQGKRYWLTPSRCVIFLSTMLLALTGPSFFLSDTPLPSVSLATTPFSVGCVLPPLRRYKHHHLTLDDYIDESKKLTRANILLWPEGAVTFRDATEREAALNKVREKISGPLIGVSFEEFFGDSSDPNGITSNRRTGMALVSKEYPEPLLTYYKRYLVPIAESFSLTHSSAPPMIYSYPLSHPHDYNKTDWAPGPDYVRSIPLTASICLDFSAPSPFADLTSRPALILGPARTWHTSVGMAMWNQAKQRADEIGSMVLWCDGGEGGVSGIAGRGITEVMQVGEGSWVREVGIPWPFNESRTFYARFGDATLVTFWAVAFAALLQGDRISLHFPASIGMGFQRVMAQIQRVTRQLGQRRVRDPERQNLLE